MPFGFGMLLYFGGSRVEGEAALSPTSHEKVGETLICCVLLDARVKVINSLKGVRIFRQN